MNTTQEEIQRLESLIDSDDKIDNLTTAEYEAIMDRIERLQRSKEVASNGNG